MLNISKTRIYSFFRCTIHQPSALLFEFFDRILLLARGGKTVYFGDIGEASETLVSYFERHGGRPFDQRENPAEYILDVIGAGVSANKEAEVFQLIK